VFSMQQVNLAVGEGEMMTDASVTLVVEQ